VCDPCRCTEPSDSVLLFSAAKASRSGPLEQRVEGLSRRLEAFVDVVLNG
jgi:hypothetical protein